MMRSDQNAADMEGPNHIVAYAVRSMGTLVCGWRPILDMASSSLFW